MRKTQVSPQSCHWCGRYQHVNQVALLVCKRWKMWLQSYLSHRNDERQLQVLLNTATCLDPRFKDSFVSRKSKSPGTSEGCSQWQKWKPRAIGVRVGHLQPDFQDRFQTPALHDTRRKRKVQQMLSHQLLQKLSPSDKLKCEIQLYNKMSEISSVVYALQHPAAHLSAYAAVCALIWLHNGQDWLKKTLICWFFFSVYLEFPKKCWQCSERYCFKESRHWLPNRPDMGCQSLIWDTCYDTLGTKACLWTAWGSSHDMGRTCNRHALSKGRIWAPQPWKCVVRPLPVFRRLLVWIPSSAK